jgi:hypothetical protein
MRQDVNLAKPGPDDPDWETELKLAFDKEWKKKGKKDGQEHVMQVAAIYVKGKNPITGYQVVLID